jgi:short-subunit dehydrogenase involved in D-alanine esterification of teichoic acids
MFQETRFSSPAAQPALAWRSRRPARQGSQVIVCGRREDALQRAKLDVPTVVSRVCDVADADGRRSVVQWMKATHLKPAGIRVIEIAPPVVRGGVTPSELE